MTTTDRGTHGRLDDGALDHRYTGPMSPAFPFPFGVSQFTTQPWSFEEDVAHLARAGVDAVEIAEAKLDPDRVDEQLAMIAEAGLRVSSVQSAVRTVLPSVMQPEPTDRNARLDRFAASVARIAPHTPDAVFVTNTGPAPEGDVAAALDRVVEDHRASAAVAREHGVRIALEPLHPVAMNQETAIWTLADALRVVAQVDRPEVGVCVDLWNLWQDPTLLDALADAGDRLFLLQVAGWRTPRSGTDRRGVDEGPIPLGRLLHAVYDAGYRGPCVLEVFSSGVADSVYDGDLDAFLERNRAALRAAW